MKSKKNLFYQLHVSAFAVVAFAMSSSAQAATFTWTGADAVTGSWAPTSTNWDTTPTFNNTADLVFDNVTRATDNEIGFSRIARSITFGDNIDGTWTTNMTSAAVLTFAADTGNASLDVTAGSTANITFNGGTGFTGSQSLTSQLEIDHKGAGLLTFNRQTAGAGGITKTGTGTFVMTGFNANSFTGPLNVNGGRIVLNNTQGATQDLAAAVAIDLGGGTLEARTTGAFGKTLSQNMTVSAASTLAYNNTTVTNRQFLFNTGSMVLNADLTVQNISTETTLANVVNISRNMTGTENVIVETYNNVNSGTTNFSLGRVAFGGANGGWSGDLVIRQGTAEVFGDSSLGQVNVGTGDIILGETANASGAGFLTAASTSGGKTIANDIIVRSGGFRTIRGGSDNTYTFNGNIALEGDLNVHNGLFFNDKHMFLTGLISGAGDLIVTKGTAGGFTRLTGDNSGWSGDLKISQGALNLFGTANTPGTGDIFIGATGDATAASLTFSHAGSLTYANDIVVNTGGTRTIQGNSGLAINVTFTGGVTLNGDLTLDHSWSTADRRITLSGPISGNGGLTISRSAGSLATTAVLSGVSNYAGPTIVASTASLAVSSAGFLASNITVQSGARLGGGGGTSGNLTLDDGANFFFFYSPTYVPFDVNGTVTVANPSTFGITSLVGGSQGEPVPWATIPDGTYTLIGTTASTFSGINNFGLANAIANIGGSGKTVYFQNGGGTSGGGLQLVVATASVDPYTTWSGGAPFDGDANNDGVDNGLAWFLGAANKDENASGLLPKATQSAGALVLDFDCLNANDRGPAIFQVQYSNDLGQLDPWAETAVPGVVGSFTAGVVDFEVTDPGAPGGLLKVVATIPAGEAAAGKLFGRVTGAP